MEVIARGGIIDGITSFHIFVISLFFSPFFFVFLLPNFLIAYKSGGFSSYAKTRAFFLAFA
jgi:hypothetical protein